MQKLSKIRAVIIQMILLETMARSEHKFVATQCILQRNLHHFLPVKLLQIDHLDSQD